MDRFKWVSAFFIIISTVATTSMAKPSAQDSSNSSPREQQLRLHQKLAAEHGKVASCLKAGGSVERCEKEMTELDGRHRDTHEKGGIRAPEPGGGQSIHVPPEFQGGSGMPIPPQESPK